MQVCRWYEDPSVPGGKFLVPGCYSRAIYGDHAICDCPKPAKRLPAAARPLLEALTSLRLDADQINDVRDYLLRARFQ